MGNDGGSIPDRRDLVRSKPKAEQADKANQTKAKWFFCALSKRPLQEPIVSCALGKLYNKDAILEYLLDKSAYGDGEKICGHIKSLKDVKTLRLTPNISATTTSSPEDKAQFICPFNLKEMNGSQPFIYIATCGCVFSYAGYKAMASTGTSPGSSSPKEDSEPKEVKKDDAEEKEKEGEQKDLCPQCGAKYTKSSPLSDIIFLNPTPEQEEFQIERLRLLRLSAPPKEKKSKKRKTVDADSAADADVPSKKSKATAKSGSSTPVPSTNPSIAAASSAVKSSLALEEAKRKAGMSEAVKSLYGDGKKDGEKRGNWMTKGTFTRYA